jgi:putative DNA primase/helicase
MSELFRGFVRTKNKKCTQKFAGGEKLLTLAQARKFDEYAGILAEDTILIDIDDGQQSEVLMNIVEDLQINCRVIQTTRGRHFYFKNKGVAKCATGARLACGLTADIKLGSKNSYAILKFDGEERFVEWEEEGKVCELPAWLLPVKTDADFWRMSEGDGRNDKLFNHILTLQKHRLQKDEIKETLRIINRYILKDKLKESELNTIMRDEAFVDMSRDPSAFFTAKGQFKFDKFSKYLIETNRIIKINRQLHIYDGGIYKLGYDAIQAEMIKHISNLNKQKRNEVMAYLDLLITENTAPSDAEWIAFRNGLYNINTDEFRDFDPSLVITNKINHDYRAGAYSEIADRTLDRLACHDEKIRALLEEVIGYTFYRRNELRKAFILTGDRHNGKSTYLDMIGQLLGDENTTALDLKELGDRFKTAEIFSKLAVLGDDIGDEFIANPAIFKKIVSGDRVNAERKGQDPFDFTPYSKLLFSANNIPRIKDKSGAVTDRLIIVPFDASFSRDDPDYDPYIKYKLRDESVMEYLVQLGLKGLRRVLDNQGFTESRKVRENIKEYEESNNPVLLFFQDAEESDVVGRQTKFVYQKYAEFCISNSYQQLSNIEFSKQVKKYFDCVIDVTRQDGKSVRVFRKIKEE